MKTRVRISGNAAVSSLVQLALMVMLVAAGVYLYLPLRTGRQLKVRLEQARAELAELEVLYPLYTELARMDTPAKWRGLAPPTPRNLSERDITSVPDRFMRLASECRLELAAASPRVHVDEDGKRYLGVELRATGPYRQLKALLTGLVQMPTLERIERLEIKREALQEQFGVVVRLALE